MFPFNRLSLAQRVVVVVALGVALRLFSEFLFAPLPPTGWTGYEPLATPSFFVSVRFHPGPVLLIQLALVAFWAGASILILRGRPATQAPAAPDGPSAGESRSAQD